MKRHWLFLLLPFAAWLVGCQQEVAMKYESMQRSAHVLKCDDPWKLMPKVNGKIIAIKGVYHQPDWESVYLDSTGNPARLVWLSDFRKDLAAQLPGSEHLDGRRVTLIGRLDATPNFGGGYTMRLMEIESVNLEPPKANHQELLLEEK